LLIVRWFLAVLLLCIALYVAGLRKALLMCLALAAAIGGWIAFTATRPITLVSPPQVAAAGATVAEQVLKATHADAAVSASAVPVSQVRLEDLHFDVNAAGAVSSVTARLHNLSENYTIGAVDYRLSLQQCAGPGVNSEPEASRCLTEREQSGALVVTVPPTQSRDVAIEIQRDWGNQSPAAGKVPRIAVEITATHIN
jgi:hypothetical protein